MKIAIVSGPRSTEAMGLELAELRLLEALRAQATSVQLDVRVVGGRNARRHAHRVGGRWIPARHRTLPRLAQVDVDLIHLIGLDLPPPRRRAFVATIHDLSPLHYDDEGVLPPWIDEIAERASFILTPSAFTATEVHRHLGVPTERIRVIGGGPAFEAGITQLLSGLELSELGIEPPFVLRYGGYTKRKDVPLLLEAWSRVPLGTLVLAGPPQPVRSALLAAAPSMDRVVVLDYVSQALLARLLRSAAVLVSTSAYEGFGLPPLEALAAGTPVVAVSELFVQELCGDAALLVHRSSEAVAEALTRVLSNEELGRRLSRAGQEQATGSTWNRAAATVLLTYRDARSSS